jgi:gamma-glutamyltranspeptidase/glutathione hydrolase
MPHAPRTTSVAALAALALLVPAAPALAGPPAASADRAAAAPRAAEPPKVPTAVGRGGAVSSVDPYATRIGLRVLARGGNAVDAAVATAAALGVTEPYSAGLGGGGFFVHYDARTGKVRTLDGRETAPRDMPRDAFLDPETGEPYPFTPDLVTSGVSVGVPGTPATWQRALDRWGTRSLARSLRPAARLAERGFVVDETFRQQTLANEVRFDAIRPTRRLFLPGGDAPAVGSTFRNPDLARTYRLLADRGLRPFYEGRIADQIVDAVRRPPKTADTDLPVPRGFMRRSDLARYDVADRRPTRSSYRGYDVYGMPPSSSGGIAVGEALNILERFDVAAMSDQDALHHYLEASALSFADRGAYVGDSDYVPVPQRTLLKDRYAAERACEIVPGEAQPKPFAAGDVTSYDGACGAGADTGEPASDHEGLSTTNLTVADRWGNVVEYTLTIEQTGGSAIVVPRRGFILNNELTDFSLEYDPDDPNRIQPGKRPRSSMSPTIVLEDGRPFVALGSPGGATIITTVLQMLLNRIDRGMTIEEALAAPRSSPRNSTPIQSEQAFIDTYGALLEAYGHDLTTVAELGAATAIEFGPGRRMTAVAEPTRRGGGAAAVVRPRGAG